MPITDQATLDFVSASKEAEILRDKYASLESELRELRKRAWDVCNLAGGSDAKWAIEELENFLNYGS